MKIVEILIAISIFSIVSIAALQDISVISHNVEKLKTLITASDYVLDVDYKIRTAIRDIKINYWEEPEKKYDIELKKLKEIEIKDVKILSVNKERDEMGNVESIVVIWEFKNKNYRTKEDLAFKGLYR